MQRNYFSLFLNVFQDQMYNPTVKEVIRAGNEIGAHAQVSVANDVFLLPFLKAFVLCIRSVHATRNPLCLPYWQHCRSHRQQFSSPCYSQHSQHPPHRLRHAHHTVGVISWFAIYKCARVSCGFRFALETRLVCSYRYDRI